MERNENRFSLLNSLSEEPEDDKGDEEHEEFGGFEPVTYVLGKRLTKYHHEGTVNTGNFSHSVSFIKARKEQKENFNLLKYLGCGNDYIVNVEQMINHKSLDDLLVAEPLIPIKVLFEKEQESFVPLGTKSEWWKKIENYFTPILTDVVHALIFLDSLGYYCGDLYNNIYVDTKGRGKVLPSFRFKTKETGNRTDITQLLNTMRFLITLPFEGNQIDDAYSLPFELLKFLKFASVSQLKYIPLYAIYNHPFFWSDQERITFILDLSFYSKEYKFLAELLDASLAGYYGLLNWGSKITPGLFKKVFDRPSKIKKQNSKPVNEESESKEEKSELEIVAYNSQDQVDLIRYVRAVFNHINEYAQDDKEYTQENIEARLRVFFPEMYAVFYEALCNVAWRVLGSKCRWNRVIKAFQKWSTCYFAKERNSIKDKVNEIFKLMSGD